MQKGSEALPLQYEVNEHSEYQSIPKLVFNVNNFVVPADINKIRIVFAYADKLYKITNSAEEEEQLSVILTTKQHFGLVRDAYLERHLIDKEQLM